MSRSLAQLSRGQEASIRGIHGHSDLGLRLQELGFTPGSTVRMVAPRHTEVREPQSVLREVATRTRHQRDPGIAGVQCRSCSRRQLEGLPHRGHGLRLRIAGATGMGGRPREGQRCCQRQVRELHDRGARGVRDDPSRDGCARCCDLLRSVRMQ